MLQHNVALHAVARLVCNFYKVAKSQPFFVFVFIIPQFFLLSCHNVATTLSYCCNNIHNTSAGVVDMGLNPASIPRPMNDLLDLQKIE